VAAGAQALSTRVVIAANMAAQREVFMVETGVRQRRLM
jgi:hypothetical protein